MTFADSSSSSSYEDASDFKSSRRHSERKSSVDGDGIHSYLDMLSTSFRSPSEPVPEKGTFVSTVIS